MKRRVLTMLLAVTMTAALISGCGGNSGEGGEKKEEVSGEEKAEQPEEKDEQEELIGWLEEAGDQCEKEPVWGYVTESTTSFDDGSTDTSEMVFTVDTEKQIAMYKYDYSTNTQLDFYTVEDGKEYWYTEGYGDYDESAEDFVKVPLKIENKEGYTRVAEAPAFFSENSEWTEVVEQKVTNAGEEDGMIKIQIDEKIKHKEFGEELTRESVLGDYGWTEEEVAYVDGVSEALDAYVKENNEEIEKIRNTEYDYVTVVWITKDEHKLMKKEGKSVSITTGDGEAARAFRNISWKVDSVKSMLEEGVSLEEAKQVVSEDMEEGETYPKSVESTYVTTFVTGADCTPLEELPKDAKEITEEQYYNGEY